ncbi:MAG TPA: FAD-binding oxidoreductase [Kofleriaceae bacterium]
MATPRVPPVMRHADKVARVIAQLRAAPAGVPLSVRKRTVPHQVPKGGDLRRHDAPIDIGELDQILRIDPDERICIAEPGVTFEHLVEATLAVGMVPVVVPELKTITIGGAVAGCSIESMSWKRGGFHDSCLAYEVITTDGEVLACTRDNEHRLVFEMMHGSFGTLGVLSQLTFELVPAEPFVHVVYETYDTLAEFQAAVADHVETGDLDFMDAIIHSPTCYVLAAGTFSAVAPYTSRYDWVKVYYRSTRDRREDYLRTADYLFRYDRGVTNVRPKSLPARLLFGKWMTSTRWLQLAEKLPWLLRERHPTVTVDVFVPASRVVEFLAWYEREIGAYPLWCVPYRRVRDYPWLTDQFWAGVDDDLFYDLAIYGVRQPHDRNYHRMLEQELEAVGGIKTLISHNYYDEAEFWTIFNKPNYDAVKAITDPAHKLRDLYEATCRAAMGVLPAPAHTLLESRA